MTQTETKTCQSCKADFVIEPDDFGFYEKMKVPPPTWCPECRMKRRMAWQGYQHLYKRKCDFTGDTVLSTHHRDSPYKVYRQDVWWSDKWDPLEYGRDIDWKRPFLEQYRELMQVVPYPALYTEQASMINSEYCNAASQCKNCYLCFRTTDAEDSAYCNLVSQLKDVFDSSYNRRDSLSYGNVITHSSYQTFFCEDVVGSTDMWFCRSAVGCHDCVATSNVSQKGYVMFGEQKNAEEYKAIFGKYDFGSSHFLEDFKKRAFDYLRTQPRKHFNNRSSSNTTGEYIYNSADVFDSFLIRKAKDIRYSQFLKSGPIADCYDYTMFGDHAENIYESSWVGMQVSNIKFSVWNYGASDLEFCFGCHSSSNLFGCIGMRKGEYSILNKKYSKEEYLQLTKKLRKQISDVPFIDRVGREYRYGEMMPPEMSPWAYNETAYAEWFDTSKEEAQRKGYNWREPDPKDYGDASVELPDHIDDVDEKITNEILKCETCGKNYRVIKKELDFLKRFKLPIPRHCPICRDRARSHQLNSMTIYDGHCKKCNKGIKTSWPKDAPEIVYCEPCYQAEVV